MEKWILTELGKKYPFIKPSSTRLLIIQDSARSRIIFRLTHFFVQRPGLSKPMNIDFTIGAGLIHTVTSQQLLDFVTGALSDQISSAVDSLWEETVAKKPELFASDLPPGTQLKPDFGPPKPKWTGEVGPWVKVKLPTSIHDDDLPF